MSGRVCKRFLISGRVQGVFFRGSAVQQAARLGLTGWVRNLPDGRVEVLAQGGEAALDKLEQWLQQGPPVARVDDVAVTPEDPSDHYDLTDFRSG